MNTTGRRIIEVSPPMSSYSMNLFQDEVFSMLVILSPGSRFAAAGSCVPWRTKSHMNIPTYTHILHLLCTRSMASQ